MVRRLLAWLFGGVALAGAGAAALALQPPDPPPCWSQTFERDAFTVCRYAPGEHELRLMNRGAKGPLGDLRAVRAALGDDAARVAFVMNAGMYDPALRPVGLYVENGETAHALNTADGDGNFFMKPNGIFWLDAAGAPRVDETAVFVALDAQPSWATQSGPLMVQAGRIHPRFMPDGASRNVRNGVGVKAGEALFAISDGPVSFGRFARFMRDGLGCPDALYLDGTVSVLWAPSLRRMDRRAGLGTFVAVLRRA